MAIVIQEKITNEKVWQCDRCKKTKDITFADVFIPADKRWVLMDNDRVLCPDCHDVIISNWYNQQESNFQLSGSVPVKRNKSRKKIIA